MYRNKVTYMILSFCFVMKLFSLQNDDYYKINKSFDVFGDTYYKILDNYVIDIDPELLMKNGIYGMLSSLDPYSEFYDEANIDDKDYFLQESYAGLGFSIFSMDSMITISGLFDDSPAQKAGIRRGDKIYSIDDNIVLLKKTEDIKQFTEGNAGTIVNITVLRNNLKDTIDFTLTREVIPLKSVRFKLAFNDSIGYINIDKFTKTTVSELKNAIRELQNQSYLKGLILDLRDNPGGLLESAVGVSEIFVQKSSLIVTTKSRRNKNVTEYKSNVDPLVPDLPLVVLINENSASAAEVVAGAIQDLDRGIVIGKKSYGKGLVQNILDLPYNNALKLTTAKYYTPSGRCIQRIKFGEGYENNGVVANPDTTVFYTKNGRPVYESTGIIPDSTIEDTETDFIKSVAGSKEFFEFANLEASKHKELSKNYQISDNTYNEFQKYFSTNSTDFQSTENMFLEKIEELSKTNQYNDKIKTTLNELKKIISEEYSAQKINSNTKLRELLSIEIKSRFLKEVEIFSEFVNLDDVVNNARNLIKSKNYFMLLSKSTH